MDRFSELFESEFVSALLEIIQIGSNYIDEFESIMMPRSLIQSAGEAFGGEDIFSKLIFSGLGMGLSVFLIAMKEEELEKLRVEYRKKILHFSVKYLRKELIEAYKK